MSFLTIHLNKILVSIAELKVYTETFNQQYYEITFIQEI